MSVNLGDAPSYPTQASANQAAVTLGNTNGAIGGLTLITDLIPATETLADDLRNLSTLVHALRTALINAQIIRGGS